jgi:hypothetical protein
MREGDVQILSADAAAAAPAPPAAQADAEAAQAPGADGSAAPAVDPPGATPAPTPEGALSWSKRVAAGDFRGVLAAAEQRGIEAVLQQGALDDLVALGDAARYAKRGDLAQRALSATRKRFPGSGPGRAAAFLLGRLADAGSPGAAISWYDTYLAESPSGPFAAEALGRKMLAVKRTAGAAAARPVAEQYLRLYPAGPHAALAKDLTQRGSSLP